jgi:hypothetical protein
MPSAIAICPTSASCLRIIRNSNYMKNLKVILLGLQKNC